MSRLALILFLTLLLVLIAEPVSAAEAPLVGQARTALRKAVAFYHGKVAAHGGYVYNYSADLTKREGEGKTGPDIVWVQPPGTPTVGLAYVEAYERTREPALLAAAKDAGECLVRGQLRSGGWAASIQFDPDARAKIAYRVDPPTKKSQSNVSTFDDDKTQSAVRFLVRLDKALEFKDARIHECVTTALDSILKAQYPSGGWGQGWESFPDPAEYPAKRASFPDEWPRKHPAAKYWHLPTTNDGAIADTVDALLLAATVYNEPKYRAAALKAGDFILLAQLPDPQPAWAQQYSADMQPAWARKFEPPAVTGGESQGLLQTLIKLYVETGDAKYLKPIPPALAYLKKSRLPNGQLARFYELRTNKPLYFTKAYELTYDGSDTPTHYSFAVSSKLEAIERQYERAAKTTPEQLAAARLPRSEKSSAKTLEGDVRRIIQAMDERGAWVENGKLKYHGADDPTKRIISSRTFAVNLGVLSRYIEAAAEPSAPAGLKAPAAK